jgi:hypothetical protein
MDKYFPDGAIKRDFAAAIRFSLSLSLSLSDDVDR